MTEKRFRKGDRVEYTLPNFGEPTTGQGTVAKAQRDGCLYIIWDHDVQRRKQFWPNPEKLRRVEA